uniref:Uncharacterized protein n=1 Tax=Amphimedon queenslandica TaxID=400682 RepID=A0A1X7TTM2_AMPQE
MARLYNADEALDLVMDDDSNEVFCSDSEDDLGFEDDVDECILATDSMVDDDVVNTTTDAGP